MKTETKQLDDAAEARRILGNPLIIQTFEAMERDIMEAWAKNPLADKDGAAELSRLIKTQRKFRAMFEMYINEGRYTEAQMKSAEEEKENLMRRVGKRLFNG